MTAISPTVTGSTPASTTTTSPTTSGSGSSSSNQINENTFLQLLVAQMQYQDPLSPTDSTDFLTQTAAFTEVSTLQQIETDQTQIQNTNQLLAASGMVGHAVTYSTTGIAPATPSRQPPSVSAATCPRQSRSAGTSTRTPPCTTMPAPPFPSSSS